MKEITVEQIQGNPFETIGKKWMLITAGDKNGYNTMTASWGSLGVLWNKNIATVFIRPQRYTKEFIDKNELFTISVYDEQYKDALKFCGAHSGRDCDKAKQTGLTPWFTDNTTSFEQASLTLICRKLYQSRISPEHYIDGDIERNYPNKDYHDVYIAEIIKAYTK